MNIFKERCFDLKKTGELFLIFTGLNFRVLHSVNSEEQCTQKSEQSPEVHRTVNSACPVPQEDNAPTVDCARTLTVG
jgi:hypothetical protein